MATFNGTVGAGADNGYVDDSTSGFHSNTAFYTGAFSGEGHDGFARWTNVTIPQGAIINSVTLTLQAKITVNNDPVNLNVYFDNEDNAAQLSSFSDYSGRAVTSAIAWSNVPDITAGTDYSSPDLASILQTVINRAGWSSGNALQLFLKDNGSGSGNYRQWKDFTTDNLNCARIAIDYTAPATTSSSSSSSSTSSTSSSTSSTSSSSSTSSTSSSSSSTSSTSSSSSTSSTSSSTSSTSSSSSTSSTSTSSTSSSHSTSSTSSSSSISTSSTSSSSTSTTLPPATTSSSSSSTSTSTSTSTTTILFHPKIDILHSLLHGRPSGEFS